MTDEVNPDPAVRVQAIRDQIKSNKLHDGGLDARHNHTLMIWPRLLTFVMIRPIVGDNRHAELSATGPCKTMPFQKGQSGNPRGRPRAGFSLAEAIRHRLDPKTRKKLLDRAIELACEPHDDTQARLKAMEWLAKHGFPEEKQRLEIDLPQAAPLFQLVDVTVRTT